jgi:hypothetical protein
MKRLVALILLLLAFGSPAVKAQYLPIYCNKATSTACTPSSLSGTQVGDTLAQAAGKTNTNFQTVFGINGILTSNGTTLRSATYNDIYNLFSGCSSGTPLPNVVTGTCVSASGTGNVSNVGTPTNGQGVEWTSATTIQGFTYGTGVFTWLQTPTAGNLGSAVTGASLVAGTGISISGSWPNQTVTATGGGGMTWPSSAGIPCYSGSSSWCTSYSGSNLIPDSYVGGLAGSPTNGQFWGYNGTAQGWYTPSGSGTVSSCTSGSLAYYASTGTTVTCLGLSGSFLISSATLYSTAPNRTVTSSATIGAGDMGGIVYTNVSGGGTTTIPAISATVLASGMTVQITNYSTSTNAISSTPTINSGGGCVSGTGIPASATWVISSNGTTLDCIQTVSSASGGSVTDGSGTTTANELLASTTTAHTYSVVATLPTAAVPAFTGDVTNSAGSLATTVGKVNGVIQGVTTLSSGTSATPNCTYYINKVTISTGTAFTVNAPGTCTPYDGQELKIEITASASGAPTYTWNGAFVASTTVPLPTAGLAASKEDIFKFEYSTSRTAWKLLAYNQEF